MLILAWYVGADGLARAGGVLQRFSGIGDLANSIALPQILLAALLTGAGVGIGMIISSLRDRRRRLELLLRGREGGARAGGERPGRIEWDALAESFYGQRIVALPAHRTVSAPSSAVSQARRCLGEVLCEADVALIVDPLPEVFAEPEPLAEIFTRLIDNAVRFRSPYRRPVVHISTVRDGAMIEFRIRDNGLGIDPARAARLFEILRQTGPGEESIGAGLVLVRRSVERMGGKIWVDLIPGQVGTTIGFSMPALPIERQRIGVEGGTNPISRSFPSL